MICVKSEKGSVTIFLVIAFTGVVLLMGLLIDLTRIKAAQNQLKRLTNSSVRSVMANYNTALKNNYGLFVINKAEHDAEFSRYIKANLNEPSQSSFSLLDLRYEQSKVTLSGTAGSQETLRKQILEAMKYKAPIELTRNLINKLRYLGNLARFFDESNEKRKSVSIVNRRMEEMHQGNEKIKQAGAELRSRKQESAEIREKINAVDGSDPRERQGLEDLRRQQSRLEKQITDTRANIDRELARLERARLESEVELKKISALKEQELYNLELPRQAPVPVGENAMKKSLETKTLGHEQELKKIELEVKQARTALEKEAKTWDLNDTLLAQICVDSATTAYKIIETDMNRPVARDVYETKLWEEADRLGKSNEPIGGLVNIVPVTDNKKAFENTEGTKVDGIVGQVKGIFEIINVADKLIKLRDELYINEYVLTYFSYLTSAPKGGLLYPYRVTEAEYVCFGGNSPSAMASAVAGVYGLRFAFDSLAYFALGTAPPELLERTIYSLIMGAIQAAVDTFRLIVLKAEVPLASVTPGSALDGIRVSYCDHIRLLLLLNSDEAGKMARIAELIKARGSVDLQAGSTLAEGQVQASIGMWFFPLRGMADLEKAPFGTSIKDGRCYFTKSVQFGY